MFGPGDDFCVIDGRWRLCIDGEEAARVEPDGRVTFDRGVICDRAAAGNVTAQGGAMAKVLCAARDADRTDT